MVEVDEYAACFGAELSPLFDPLPHDDRGVAQSLHAAEAQTPTNGDGFGLGVFAL
jgi:predicted glutamine amidotransferase